MSYKITQEAEEYDIYIENSDDLNIAIKFDIPLTGYTFSAYVEWATGRQKLNVNVIDLSTGDIELEILKEHLAHMPALQEKTWSLVWTVSGKSRKVFKGKFEI